MSKSIKLDADLVRETIAQALRDEAKRRDVTVAVLRSEISEGTSLPERTLQNYDLGLSSPIDYRFLLIAGYLGARFTNTVLGLCGQGHAIDLDIVEEAPDGFKMQAELAKGMNELATALSDAVLDHREMAELAPQCHALGHRLIEFGAQCNSTVKGRRNI